MKIVPESNRKRVVIVDDSRTMQALLEQTLSVRLGYDVVGISGDGRTAISMIRRLRPDLVTIDLMLPYVDGQQLLKELAIFPDMYKVVISANACSNLEMKGRLESLGADGCLCKREMSRDPAEFCRLLSAIVRKPRNGRATRSAPTDRPRSSTAGYPVPADERERLAALDALGLANDNAEYRLDLLTEHLVKTTSFSACVMTFIGQNTAWIKSGYGLERGSAPRSQAICAHTICGDEPFIVHDTLSDVRFSQFDAVRSGAMIRSYVGYPIIGSSGVRLGAICLLDTTPRRVTLKELTNLRSIARIAAQWIEDRASPITHAA